VKSLLFISHFPTNKTIQDGMKQRIFHIDKVFNEIKRTYLSISFTKNIKKRISVDGNRSVIRVNFFFHFLYIIRIIYSFNYLYIHSIYNYLWVFPFFLFRRNNKFHIVLDLHGAVPEELSFSKKHLLSFIYSKLEKSSFKKIHLAITVSNSMKNHFLSKYKFYKGNYFTFYIQPENVFDAPIKNIKPALGIMSNNIVFVYSGNSQAWQNTKLMLNEISKLNNPNYIFIILTLDIDYFNKLIISNQNLSHHKIILKTVEPSELPSYYSISNYGFILRNEHILNMVSSPTKMIEYLFYGITPITLSNKIGDFNQFGYEYLSVYALNNNLVQIKSYKNNLIAREFLKDFKAELKDSVFINPNGKL
jgi:glycosyltransferase involved in cell wall biosynthesis